MDMDIHVTFNVSCHVYTIHHVLNKLSFMQNIHGKKGRLMGCQLPLSRSYLIIRPTNLLGYRTDEIHDLVDVEKTRSRGPRHQRTVEAGSFARFQVSCTQGKMGK
jgi:hypothetical protein